MRKIRQNKKFSNNVWTAFLLTGILFWGNRSLISEQPNVQNIHGQTTQNEEGDRIKFPDKLSLELVQTFPHQTDSYCQGLYYCWDEKVQRPVLYESAGQYGKSKLRKVDIQTGKTLHEMKLSEHFFGEGLAVVGNLIYVLTWRERTCLVFDRETLKQVDDFRYANEGWGLTFDGKNLIMSDGTAKLRFLNPKTFKIEKTLDVYYYNNDGKKRNVQDINELEFIEGEIWANVFQTPYIIRIDSETGQVIEVLNFQSLIPKGYENDTDWVLNGIAYNPQNHHIFITGKCWPTLYEIKITNLSNSQP